ncbi:MAG: hypothetical protein Q7J56_01900 [Deltaproteobacteria bacterium]|nr:hypothetical protein [Deltaproteobacteria bacterium]
MRIVHELWHKAQTTATGNHYSFRVDVPPGPYTGAQVEVLIVATPRDGGAEEAIYIEGDLACIKDALEDVVGTLIELDRHCRETYDEDVAAHWQSGHERYVADRRDVEVYHRDLEEP